MANRSTPLDAKTLDYVRNISLMRENGEQARIREATAGMSNAQMQISVEQGQLMGVLARLVNAKRAIEVGVFTGYSALSVAKHLPKDGLLIACDVSDEWTSIGKPMWRDAGVMDCIDLRLGPAGETLDAMIKAGESGTFDFAFIDADKEAYAGYYKQCLTLLRAGGVMVIDNIFMGGRAVDPKPDQAGPTVVHTLSKKIFADDRVDPAMVPIGDGIIIARKR